MFSAVAAMLSLSEEELKQARDSGKITLDMYQQLVQLVLADRGQATVSVNTVNPGPGFEGIAAAMAAAVLKT